MSQSCCCPLPSLKTTQQTTRLRVKWVKREGKSKERVFEVRSGESMATRTSQAEVRLPRSWFVEAARKTRTRVWLGKTMHDQYD